MIFQRRHEPLALYYLRWHWNKWIKDVVVGIVIVVMIASYMWYVIDRAISTAG